MPHLTLPQINIEGTIKQVGSMYCMYGEGMPHGALFLIATSNKQLRVMFKGKICNNTSLLSQSFKFTPGYFSKRYEK